MNYVKSLSLAVCLLVVPAMQASAPAKGTGRISAAYSWVATTWAGKKVGGFKDAVVANKLYVGLAAALGGAVYVGQKYNKNFRDTYFTPAVAKVVAYKNALLSREVNREKVGTGVVLAIAGAYVYRNEIGNGLAKAASKRPNFLKSQAQIDADVQEAARAARDAREAAQQLAQRKQALQAQIVNKQDENGAPIDDAAVAALQTELDALPN